MFTFIEFHKQLNERFLSIGLNPNHEKHREKHRFNGPEFNDVIDLIKKL